MVGAKVVNAQPVRPACEPSHARGPAPVPAPFFSGGSHSPTPPAPIVHVLWCAGSPLGSSLIVTDPSGALGRSPASTSNQPR